MEDECDGESPALRQLGRLPLIKMHVIEVVLLPRSLGTGSPVVLRAGPGHKRCSSPTALAYTAPPLCHFLHPLNHTHYRPTAHQEWPWALLGAAVNQTDQPCPGIEGGRHSQLRGPGQDGRHREEDASVGTHFELGRRECSEKPEPEPAAASPVPEVARGLQSRPPH